VLLILILLIVTINLRKGEELSKSVLPSVFRVIASPDDNHLGRNVRHIFVQADALL
jgi:hypothetical protein